MLSTLTALSWFWDGYGRLWVFTWDCSWLHPVWGYVVQAGLTC